MNIKIKSYFAQIGKKGGQKSRRKLTKDQSLQMIKIREKKRKKYKK